LWVAKPPPRAMGVVQPPQIGHKPPLFFFSIVLKLLLFFLFC